MKKFIVACAAVSAITVAAGMSAMAAEYTAENNSVKFTVPAGDTDSQKTVLVIPKDKKGSVTDEDILYINQDAALADSALLKGTELKDGTYVVMVGYYNSGAFQIAEEEFTLGDVPGGDTREILMGDVTGDGLIESTDAQQVMRYSVRGASGAGFASDPDKLIAADVTADGLIESTDAQQIMRYSVRNNSTSKAGKTAVVDANNNIIEYK